MINDNYKSNIIKDPIFRNYDIDGTIGNGLTHVAHVGNNSGSNNSNLLFTYADYSNNNGITFSGKFNTRQDNYGIDLYDDSIEVPIIVTTNIISKNYYAGRMLDALLNFNNSDGTTINACKIYSSEGNNNYIFSGKSNEDPWTYHKIETIIDLFKYSDISHPAILPGNDEIFHKFVISSAYNDNDYSRQSPINDILNSKIFEENNSNIYNVYYEQNGPFYKSTQDAGDTESKILSCNEGNDSNFITNSKLTLSSLKFYFQLYYEEEGKEHIITKEDDKSAMLDTSISFFANNDNNNDTQIGLSEGFVFRDAFKKNNTNNAQSKISFDESSNSFVIEMQNSSLQDFFYVGFITSDRNRIALKNKNMTYDVSYVNCIDTSTGASISTHNADYIVNVNVHSFLRTKIIYSEKRPIIKLIKIIPKYLDNLSYSLNYIFKRSVRDDTTDSGDKPDLVSSNQINNYFKTSISVIQPFLRLTKNDKVFSISKYLTNINNDTSKISYIDDKEVNPLKNGSSNDYDIYIPFEKNNDSSTKYVYKIIINKQKIKFSIDFKDITYDGIPVNTLFKEMPLKFDSDSNDNMTHDICMKITCRIKGVDSTDITTSKVKIIKPTLFNSLGHSNKTLLFKYFNNKTITCSLPLYDIKQYLNDRSTPYKDITNFPVNEKIDSENEKKYCDNIQYDFIYSTSESNDSKTIKCENEYSVKTDDNGNLIEPITTTEIIKFAFNLNFRFKNSDKFAIILDPKICVRFNDNDNEAYLSDLFSNIYLTGDISKIKNEFEFNLPVKEQDDGKFINDNFLYNKGDSFLLNEIYNIGSNKNNSGSDEVIITDNEDVQNGKYIIIVLDNSTCKVKLFSSDNNDNIENMFGECLTDKYSLYATKFIESL